MKRHRLDKFWIGLVCSLSLPFFFSLIYFESFFPEDNISYFQGLKQLSFLPSLMGKFILFSITPNLVLFFIFYKSEWWRAASGLIVGTIPYFITSISYMV